MPYEKSYIVTANGDVYVSKGTAQGVGLEGINTKGATITHNHPGDDFGSGDSFGKNDFEFLQNNPDSIKVLKELDISWNEVCKKGLQLHCEEGKIDEDQHYAMEWLRKKGYVDYVRRNRNE